MGAALALGAAGACAVGAAASALALRTLGERAVLLITLTAVAAACAYSLALGAVYFAAPAPFTVALYEWGPAGLGMRAGFLVDSLSVLMLALVTTVSLLVHIYSIGYMRDDPGRARFFCYLSLFTLAMALLVLADNFLLLFLGWEGVGVASYLLIGFWHTRESATRAGLKAFLMNRAGDLAFLLGIGALLAGANTLDYAGVFAAAPALGQMPGAAGLDLLTLALLLLFAGAMGKSAQMPLHAWLPDSMEGPTPISAMIHAATMVTAGIYMVARLSPLYEASPIALQVILVVGATTALATGLLGLVANDIKRVLAYSTLSQLGYMVAALGASAYAAAVFHLFTHAFFKALLFLAAGSVIIALHHEQDLRRMGGLARRLPWTAACFAVGALALAGFPGFAGYFSKEAVINAVAQAPGDIGAFAHALLLAGVAVTALYMLRLWTLAFAGAQAPRAKTAREPDWTLRAPLLILAAATLASPLAMEFLLAGGLGDALAGGAADGPGLAAALAHAAEAPPVWLLAATLLLWPLLNRARAAGWFDAQPIRWAGDLLRWQYGFDALYERVLARLGRRAGAWCAGVADARIIDHGAVLGTARLAKRTAALLRRAHTGLLNHYALGMALGLICAVGYLLAR